MWQLNDNKEYKLILKNSWPIKGHYYQRTSPYQTSDTTQPEFELVQNLRSDFYE